LALVQKHLPAGSKLYSSGYNGSPLDDISVEQSWPAVPGVLDLRLLRIEASRTKNGTELYAESQDQWVITRPTSERIPAGVHEVVVTDSWPGSAPFLSRSVTRPATVHKLVGLFNSLGTVQPGTVMCPAPIAPLPIVKVVFRTSGTGPAAASATVSTQDNISWPTTVAGWVCVPIGFKVGGRSQTPLIGNVIAPIQRLLDVKLTRRVKLRPQ
jgi:hypothetical protein